MGMRVEILSHAFFVEGIPCPLVNHSPSKGKIGSELCLCSSLWIVGFLWDLVISLFRGVCFVDVPLFSVLAPLMYLWQCGFLQHWVLARDNSSLEFDSWPPLNFSLERLLGVLYTKGCNSRVGLLLVVYLLFEALCQVGGLFTSQ